MSNDPLDFLQQPSATVHLDRPPRRPGAVNVEATPFKRSWWQRYREYCGSRSMIFQWILLGWTAFGFGSAALSLVLAIRERLMSPQLRSPYAPKWSEEVVAGLVCQIMGWFVVAIPFLIAAIATLDGGRKKR